MNMPADLPAAGHPERDTLLLVADIVAEGETSTFRFMVRNLSAGGLMAQGDHALELGRKVSVTMRNVGTVQGKVAWVENGRYGIAFDHEIDQQAVRAPTALAAFLSDTIKLRPRA
jgi:hypothetical protein